MGIHNRCKFCVTFRYSRFLSGFVLVFIFWFVCILFYFLLCTLVGHFTPKIIPGRPILVQPKTGSKKRHMNHKMSCSTLFFPKPPEDYQQLPFPPHHSPPSTPPAIFCNWDRICSPIQGLNSTLFHPQFYHHQGTSCFPFSSTPIIHSCIIFSFSW